TSWSRTRASRSGGRSSRSRRRTGGACSTSTSPASSTARSRLRAGWSRAKAGVILLARTVALELAPKVRVNAVCPGYVLTPMQRAEYTDEMLAEVNASIPLGRHAAPEEIAGLYAFLASDEGAYFTGAVISMDGGEIA